VFFTPWGPSLRWDDEGGFTLVELMVVIVIIGLLATVVIINVLPATDKAAIEECERFYPVFQFVLWAGKTPQEAIAAALIETQGEA